jgi:hypothetical protein
MTARRRALNIDQGDGIAAPAAVGEVVHDIDLHEGKFG